MCNKNAVTNVVCAYKVNETDTMQFKVTKQYIDIAMHAITNEVVAILTTDRKDIHNVQVPS